MSDGRLADAMRYLTRANAMAEDLYMHVSDVGGHGARFGEIKVQLRAAQIKLADAIQAEPSRSNELSQTPEPSAAHANRVVVLEELLREALRAIPKARDPITLRAHRNVMELCGRIREALPAEIPNERLTPS